jgi:hypothetical protein
MDVDPPPAVRDAAAGLGPVLGHRREDPPPLWWFVTGVVVITVAGEWLCGYLAVRGADPWLTAVLGLLMVGGVVYAASLIVLVTGQVRTREPVDVYEFEGGLVRATGGDVAVFPWRGSTLVENVALEGGGQGGLTQRRVFTLRAADHSGRIEPLILTRDHERISALVVQASLPDVLAAARSPLGASFGALTLGPDGVTVDGTTTPWMRVERVVRDRDELRVYRRGEAKPWARRPVGQVPGLPLLLAAAECLLADAGPT